MNNNNDNANANINANQQASNNNASNIVNNNTNTNNDVPNNVANTGDVANADKSVVNNTGDSNCIKNIIWCQEEPKNMGAWNYIASKLYDEVDMQDIKIKYVGRKESASPACGSHHRHELEQEEIVKTCFQ